MRKLKKSWVSRSTRQSNNKYDCQSCNKEREKNRRVNQIKRGIIHVIKG